MINAAVALPMEDVATPPVDCVAEAEMIVALQKECETINQRQVQIRQEISERFAKIQTLIPGEPASLHSERRLTMVRNNVPEKPDKRHTIEHSFNIAAGHAITKALKDGMSMEECEEVTMGATLKVAQKRGFDNLPMSVVESIKLRIRTKYAAILEKTPDAAAVSA